MHIIKQKSANLQVGVELMRRIAMMAALPRE
jgi:hypothetical protein